MKFLFLPVSLSFLMGLSFAHAVETSPAPHADKQEKIDSIRSGGAVKVEQKPAMTTHELEGTTPPAASEKSLHEKKSDKTAEHLFGAHAALGFPHVGSLGLNYVHSSHYFSAEISAGGLNATFSDVKVKLNNSEIALRWHPWAGSFYLGALVGHQVLKADKRETITAGLQSQDVNAHVEVKSNYVTPHFGWMWGAQDTGFFASMEFGYQSPSKVTTDFNTDAEAQYTSTADYQQLVKDVRDQGDNFGNMGLPHVVLLKIGWLF